MIININSNINLMPFCVIYCKYSLNLNHRFLACRPRQRHRAQMHWWRVVPLPGLQAQRPDGRAAPDEIHHEDGVKVGRQEPRVGCLE